MKRVVVFLAFLIPFFLTACGGGGGSVDGGNAPTLTSISISPQNPTIAAESTVQLSVTGTYSDGSTAVISSVGWNSTLTSIATVSASGLVTGVSVGSTSISAMVSGLMASTNVTITPSPNATLQRVALQSNFPTTVSRRSTGNLSLVAYYSDGTIQATTGVTWTSSNPAVMTVDSSGNFAGVSAGTATITATYNGKSDSKAFILMNPVATPVIMVTCTASSPMTISASAWNTAFQSDPTNATEWVVVDPVTCGVYPEVVLLPRNGGFEYLGAPDVSSTVYGPAIIYSINGTLSVGTQIDVGYTTGPKATTYTLLYTLTAS